MAGTEIDIVGGPAVFRPQADGSTLAFYKRTDKVDSALWSPDNSSVTEQASYTPEQYEQYRQEHPELDLPAFNFDPPPLTGGYRGTGNTVGNITGETPGNAVKAEAANPEVDKNLLEQAKDGIDQSIDDWVERSGYSTGAMIGGALAKAAVEVFMPTAYWELIPLAKAGKIASKGAEAIGDLVKTEKAAEAGKDASKVGTHPSSNGGGKVRKAKSLREQYLGRTPGKNSRTGREVQERMRQEGRLRDNIDTGDAEFQASDGKWYNIKYADMAHKTDAVKWWNELGRQYGAKAPEVRHWMLDPRNYQLDHLSFNRSAGAKLGERYLPPAR